MKRNVIDHDSLSRIETALMYFNNPMNGYFGGNRKSAAYGSTVEFADYREYMPGDDLRRIDWNVFARFDKYMTRLFVDERRIHTQIFIDCSASMAWGEPEKAQTALRLAAIFGYLSVRISDRVSYKLIKGKSCVDLCGEFYGKEAFYRAADKLSYTDFNGDADLAAGISKCENPGFNNGLTVIISDFFTDSNWKSAVDFLLHRKRRVLLAQILSPDEISPEYSGRIQFIDSEAADGDDYRNLRLDIGKSSMKVYTQTLQLYEKDIKNFCNSRNVDFLSFSTADSLEKTMFRKGVIR